MVSIASSLIYFVALGSPQTLKQGLQIQIDGPIATIVSVQRIAPPPSPSEAKETVLDLELPQGAILLDGTFETGTRSTVLRPASVTKANAVLAHFMAKERIPANETVPDDGVDARVRIPRRSGPSTLRIRMAVPLLCDNGQFLLRIPASLEQSTLSPVELSVNGIPRNHTLSLSYAGITRTIPPNLRRFQTQFETQNQSPLEIRFALTPPTSSSDTFPGPVLAVTGKHTRGESDWRALAVCRQDRAGRIADPKRVIFLVDRSRSMGRAIVNNMKALITALANRLPPNTLVNTVFFSRESHPSFPTPRLATREVVNSLAGNLDPNGLENGSDFVSAFELAALQLTTQKVAGRDWIVLITDGDLPGGQTAHAIRKAMRALDPSTVHLLTLFLRQTGDDDIPAGTLREFGKLVEPFGGLLRRVSPDAPDTTATDIIAAMALGGDLVNLRVGDAVLAESIQPQKGGTYVWWSSNAQPDIRGRLIPGGAKTRVAFRRRNDISMPREKGPQALLGDLGSEPVAVIPRTPNENEDGIVRGQMDPHVLRNALSLAFLPRARACYLSRKVSGPGDVYLQGRVRLSLSLSRGELQGSVILSSSLGRPEIEECVRNAAMAIEYPRPEHRDSATVANLNLVFRPATPEDVAPTTSSIDREIELILTPLMSSPQSPQQGADAGR